MSSYQWARSLSSPSPLNSTTVGKLARAEIAYGYEAAKVYIRNYGTDIEYMIRLPPIDDCKRSYLADVMPYPEILSNRFLKVAVIDGVSCNHFLHEDFETQVHMYFDRVSGAPVRLIQESVENGVCTTLMSYDYSSVVLGPSSVEMFKIPDPHTHINCTRHNGGFPYIHIFHSFVRF